MRLALRFEERLAGSYRFGDERDRPLRLELVATSTGGGRFDVTGLIDAPGLAARAPLEGRITLGRPLRISYALTFPDDAGRSLRLVAEKARLLEHAYASLTTLRGELVETQEERRVAVFAARFDARGDIGWWLSRLRLMPADGPPSIRRRSRPAGNRMGA